KAPPDSVDRIRRDPMVPAVQAGAGRYSEPFLAAIDAGLRVDERERPQNAAQWRELFGGVSVRTTALATIQPATVATVAPSAPPPVSVPVSQPFSHPAPSLRPTIEPPPPPSILSAPPTARAGARGKMMIAAGVAVVLIGGGVAAALSMGGSSTPAAPQAVKPDNASIQLAAAEKERIEADKRRTTELEKRLADEEARRKAAEEQQAKMADADKRRQAEEEARKKSEAEAESRKRIEEDTRKKVEAEFKTRAEEDAKKRKIEEEAQKKIEEARLKADEAKRKTEEAKQKVEQKTGGNPQVAAAPAASPPTADPAAYVAQHWSIMKPQAETALRNRGVVSDSVTGSPIRFGEIRGYRVVSVNASTVTVVIDFNYVRANTSGGGNISLNNVSERATFKNESPKFPLIAMQGTGVTSSANAPRAEGAPIVGATSPQQTAAVQPWQSDPAGYVTQHWPTMKPKIEAALKQRGAVMDTVSGVSMRFEQLYNYRIMQVTAAQIVLSVSYRNVRAMPGAGHTTGSNQDVSETAIFQNQPPDFPLVSMK
ncbi:MAG: hypothetical protein K0S54_2428, partial [Alphaproteobacteria bacterium]|nr:hypothetical protein [Alphaproteobacteria bacterium]